MMKPDSIDTRMFTLCAGRSCPCSHIWARLHECLDRETKPIADLPPVTLQLVTLLSFCLLDSAFFFPVLNLCH